MHHAIRILTLGILFLLVAAPPAYAWGAGVHLAIGNHILNNLGFIKPAIAALLASHASSFLYGCLSADIFIGKGCRTTPTHSHNWLVGQRLLEQAPSDALKAYAYGYLSHLAADTVAHNFYVPTMLAQTPGSGKLNHVYIEMQADMRVEWNLAEAKALFKASHQRADKTLLEVTAYNPLPFYLKKQLFRGSVLASGRKPWHTSLELIDQVLPKATDLAYLDQMLLLSRNLVRDYLSNPQDSVVLSLDPVGTRHLTYVHQARKGRRKAVWQNKALPIFPIPLRLKDLIPRNPAQETWLRPAKLRKPFAATNA